ncbi:MAG: hypothetical protein AABN33_08570 [Acidobacteriota bacterium]
MILEDFGAIPPTQLVDLSYPAYKPAARPVRIPPTQVVDRSYAAYKTGGPGDCVGGIQKLAG